MKLYFATSNKHKIEEAKAIAKALGVSIALEPLPLQLDEPRGTFEEISREKARQAFTALKEMGREGAVFVEDAGIIVEAFSSHHPFPGPYSRYIYETLGLEGLLGALERILEKGLDKGKGRKAYFVSVVTYTEDGETFHQFKGHLKGRIADKVYVPEGEWKGMMYDRIFIPEGYNQTLSMLGLEVKNRLSHRRKALEGLFRWLSERSIGEREKS